MSMLLLTKYLVMNAWTAKHTKAWLQNRARQTFWWQSRFHYYDYRQSHLLTALKTVIISNFKKLDSIGNLENVKCKTSAIPANTRWWSNVILTLVHRQRRWANAKQREAGISPGLRPIGDWDEWKFVCFLSLFGLKLICKKSESVSHS